MNCKKHGLPFYLIDKSYRTEEILQFILKQL